LSSTLSSVVTAYPSVDILVELVAPVHVLVSVMSPVVSDISGFVAPSGRSSRMASLDRFMSEWTQLVGDPVLSKWIVVALVVSILLNGYLLKGIASSTAPDGASGPTAVAAAAARLVTAAGVWEADGGRKDALKMRRRWSGGIQLEKSSKVKKAEDEDDETAIPTITGPNSRRQSVMQNLVMPIPVHLPHPAPHSILRSGDITPTCGDNHHVANGSARTVAVELGHIHVNRTPTVPIAPVINFVGDSPSPPREYPTFGRRSLEECWEIYAGGLGAFDLSDEEVILLVEKGKIPGYGLEKGLKDLERAVRVRRAVICESWTAV
jgi:hydroxymethylglutaryl-CoA reductase (NADPH)